MNRRGFLSLLGMSAAGLALGGGIPSVLIYEPTKWATYQAHDAVGLKQITAEIAKVLESIYPTDLIRGHRLGEHDGPLVLNHQVWIQIGWDHGVSIRKGEIQAHAEMLAAQMRKRGITHLGSLNVPQGVESGALVIGKRACVRGVAQYDVVEDRLITRFDVIGSGA